MKDIIAACVLITICLTVNAFPIAKTPALAGGTIVYPSEAADPAVKAQEDWQAISSALLSAGPGDVVKLGAGTFYLNKSVIIESFSGTLKGAGIGKTVVRTAPGQIFDLTPNPVLTYVDGYETKQSAMFLFLQPVDMVQRSVSVSGLSIICDQPSNGWHRGYPSNPETGLNSVGGITVANSELTVEEIINLDVDFRDIKVDGLEHSSFSSPNGTNFSCTFGVSTNGAANGVVSAKNLEVTNAVFGAGLFVWVGEGSHIQVSDSVFRNTFVGLYADGWHRLTVTGTKVIDNNRIGMSLWNSPVYLPAGFTNSEALVSDNSFKDGGVIDIYLDRGTNVSVLDNEFRGATAFTSILAVRQSNSDFRNNRFVKTVGAPGPNLLVAVSQNVVLQDNNHKVSGKAGWTGDPLNGDCQDGPGAILVDGSNNTYISGERFPANTSGDTMICDLGTGTQYIPK